MFLGDVWQTQDAIFSQFKLFTDTAVLFGRQNTRPINFMCCPPFLWLIYHVFNNLSLVSQILRVRRYVVLHKYMRVLCTQHQFLVKIYLPLSLHSLADDESKGCRLCCKLFLLIPSRNAADGSPISFLSLYAIEKWLHAFDVR